MRHRTPLNQWCKKSHLAATRAAVTMPHLEAELAVTLVTLLPAAREGNARAACRIALERIACRTFAERKNSLLFLLRAQEAIAEAVPGEGDADRIARLQIALLERERQCRSLPAELADDGTDWLARAAAAGHLESTLRYISGQGLGWVEGVEPSVEERWALLGHPHFAAWQRDAPLFAQRLLANGEPSIVFVLRLAYAQAESPFSGLVRDEPVEVAAMGLLLAHLNGRPPRADALLRLTPSDQARARSRFNALREQFGDRRFDRSAFARASEPVTLALLSARSTEMAPPCGP